MLNRRESICLLDPEYFDNQVFWDELRKLDEAQVSDLALTIKKEVSAFVRILRERNAMPTKMFAIKMLEMRRIEYFSVQYSVCILGQLIPEYADNLLLKCRNRKPFDDGVWPNNKNFDDGIATCYYLDCYNEICETLYLVRKARIDFEKAPCFFVGQDPIVVSQEIQRKTRSTRLSPRFILNCLLMGGTVIVVAMLLGASFGTACLTVAAVGMTASLALACVGVFSKPPANASSSLEELEPEAPSGCCVG